MPIKAELYSVKTAHSNTNATAPIGDVAVISAEIFCAPIDVVTALPLKYNSTRQKINEIGAEINLDITKGLSDRLCFETIALICAQIESDENEIIAETTQTDKTEPILDI